MPPALATALTSCFPATSSPAHYQVQQLHRHSNGLTHSIQHDASSRPQSNAVLARAAERHQSYAKERSIARGITQEGFHYNGGAKHGRHGCLCGSKGVSSTASLQGRMNRCSRVGKGDDYVAFTASFDRHRAGSKRRRRCYRVLAVLADASTEVPSENKEVAILWFKKDLRLDDHIGLSLAAAYRALLPVYIFDPYLLRGWSLEMLEELVDAVAELKLALQGVGSDLIIRRGSVKAELTALAAEVSATVIIAEEEIEHEWLEAMSSIADDSLKDDVNSCFEINIETWTAPLYESKGKPFPRSYKETQKMQSLVKPPLQAPTSLPTVAEGVEKGCIPSASAIENDVRALLENNIWHKKLKDLQSNGAETLLSMKDKIPSDEELLEAKSGVFEGFNSWREKYILASPYEALEKRRAELALRSQEDEAKKSSGVGPISIKGTLDAYLRFLEPTRRKDWKIIYDVVSEAEYYGPRGASFRVLFGKSLTLGTLSRRRVYHEAFEYEKARNGGVSSPFGFSTFTAKAAVQDVKSSEWYRMLAAASEEDSSKRGWHVRTWSWRGFLIQYVTMGEHGLPIVLVHGFGAFWEHYRDNIRDLSKSGNRVWALTLLGFGRSEKPDVAYTELLWSELIRDFIVEVVGEPAILVGNSIGGYMVSMVAGLWPQIVKSLILLNTAGAILPDHSSCTYVKPKARTGITWAGAQLSLSYLRSAASQLLKKYYCVNPSRVDRWLTGEILRASHDPGAAIVLESFYCLKNPFPLNWFLDRYKGKIFVIQGSKDPLSNSTKRKQLFESYCSNAVVQLVDAGHCPHDEIPDEVNKLIVNWIQQNHLQQSGAAQLPQAVQCVENV